MSEEKFLRGQFTEFDAYARRVPRLLPRLTPGVKGDGSGRFDRERYMKHREYNAGVGACAIYVILIGLLVWRTMH